MVDHSPKSSKLDVRVFESEPAALKSLRLIAAPDPKDDLFEKDLDGLSGDTKYSPELIRNLINFVKSL